MVRRNVFGSFDESFTVLDFRLRVSDKVSADKLKLIIAKVCFNSIFIYWRLPWRAAYIGVLLITHQPASVAQLDARPTGDQEVAGSTPTEVGNILSWRIIIKYFLRLFSSFR